MQLRVWYSRLRYSPIGTHQQVWLKVAKLEVVLVIYTKRENVFVELSPLAGYVVTGAQGINARFKSIVDEAHAWHSAYHLTRIRILRSGYFLCRNIAHDDGTVFGHLYHCRIRITPFHCGNGHLLQLLFIRLQRNHLVCVLRLNPVNFLSLIS